MYKLKILTIEKELLETKKFHTIQELKEYYYEFEKGNKLLINDNWYEVRVREKKDNDYKFYVSKFERGKNEKPN